MFYYYHPESDCLWSQDEPLTSSDGLVEELTETEYKEMAMQIKNFDATNIPPQQAGGKHPVGNFPFQISNTYGRENQSKDGGMLSVEMTSPAGSIVNNYNLFNKSDKAREIAHKELSALCHATGIFRLTFEDPQGNPLPFSDWARELRGGRGTMDVGLQDTSKPDGYVEVKKVYDANGNEPGKVPTTQPQGGRGNWGAPANTQQQPQPPAGNAGDSWGQTTQPPQGWQAGPTQQQPAQQQPSANTGGAAKPPWLS